MAKVFKDYAQHQLMLLPPSLEELIAVDHPVRVVNSVIDRLDLKKLNNTYRGGGASSYHPRMLLKVLVYGYVSNVYSSRKMESSLKANIHFMWLSGMQRPDHNTINRFRNTRLKGIIKEVFGKVVELLVESGHVSLKRAYTDGTKIEANANKYTFVWGKAIQNSKKRIAEQLEDLWEYAESVASEELKDKRPTTFAPVNREQLEKTIEDINTAIGKKKVSPKVKQKLNYARRNWPDKIDEYKKKEQILADRNSYSKTDPDATFMRMKEDHMKNGQLKPGYNFQISTNDQYILNYSLHQQTTDTTTLSTHLQGFKDLYGSYPEDLIADAGYGSEENYMLLESLDIESYVKYNTFDISKKRVKWEKKYPFHVSSLFYNSEKDCFICPMGQEMKFKGTTKSKTKTGFIQEKRKYQAKNCQGCPLRSSCHKSKNDRIIEVNFNLKRLREEVKQRLETEKGIIYRKKRPVDVEPVFGHIKHNRGRRRFWLRGLEKVEIEAGLIAIAHNLLKSAS